MTSFGERVICGRKKQLNSEFIFDLFERAVGEYCDLILVQQCSPGFEEQKLKGIEVDGDRLTALLNGVELLGGGVLFGKIFP